MQQWNSKAFQYEIAEGRIIRGNVHYARNQAPEATVVIIHGFKGFKDWGMFPYAADQLAKSFDVVRLNLSRNGVGESLTDFDELDKFSCQTFSGDLEDVHDLVLRLKEGRIPLAGARQPKADNLVLIGHSRGGGEAIVYALDHPENVAGVISWNGTTRFDRMFGEEALRSMRETGTGYIVNARTKQKMPLSKVILDDLEANAERFDVLSRIGGLRVPLVLVQGTEDYPNLQLGSERLVEANPAVQWIRVPGGDHTFCTQHPFQGASKQLETALEATVKAIRSMLV